MARPLRIDIPNTLYHLLSRGNQRQKVFLSTRDREQFLHYLKEYKDIYGIKLYTYCLMDNHFHLLIETTQSNLSEFMRRLLSSYTIYFNTKRKQSGHLFQGRFKSLIVDKEEYLLELSRYIHLNPVRAKIIKKPEEYDWSSLKEISGIKTPQGLMDVEDFFGYSGSDSKGYLNFVYQGIGQEAKFSIFKRMFIGSKKFINKVQRKAGNTEEAKGKKSPEEVIKKVIKVIKKHYKLNNNHLQKRSRKNGQYKKIAMYLVRKMSQARLSQIGNAFGGISAQAVAKSISEIQALSGNRRFAREVDRILVKLKS